MDGGLNNSVYVSDPNQWVDPMGLSEEKYTKENKLISNYENKQISKIVDTVTTPAKLTTIGVIKLGNTIGSVSNDLYNGAKIGVDGIKTAGNIAKPYIVSGANATAELIKDSSVGLYNGAKDLRNSVNYTILASGVRGVAKLKEATNRSGQLIKTLCYMHYGCKLPDYLYCSHSGGRRGVGAAVNLWNGQSYMVIGVDGTYVPKHIYKGIKNTSADIKKMSQLLGGQCSLGFIYNTSGPKDDSTDDFLKGGAGGVGATIRNIRLGVSSPIGKDWLSLNTPKAIEVGLNSEKADVDAGASISIPLVKTPMKY